jgi:hypothetical protein
VAHSNFACDDRSRKLLIVPFIAGLFLALLISTGIALAQSPVPLVNQPLIPDTIAPGSAGFELTLNGTGFVSGSVVNWNGSPRTTTFESSSQLTASILASDVAKHGSGWVTVLNPSPGGGVSNAISFEVTRPIPLFTFNRSDYLAGSGVPSVVAADFNGDGNLDIAAVGLYTNTVSVYLGNGYGKFEHHGDYPTGCGNCDDSLVVGDFNGDGKLDLAVRGVSVLLGNGDGSFQKPLVYPAGNNALAVGDFNGDGKLDLASSDSSGAVYILLGNGDGTFQTPVPYAAGLSPGAIAVGDFNGDGKLDLAVALSNEKSVAILLGNADGTFQPTVKYAAAGESSDVYAADLNGDGILDLVVPCNSLRPDNFLQKKSVQKVSVLIGNGDGTFKPHVDYPAGTDAYRGGVADVNGDGKLDVVVTSWFTSNNQFFVLLGNGDGTLQKPRAYTVGYFPLGITFGDFNNDGILDLVIADQGTDEISVMLGTVVELQPDTLDFGSVSVGNNVSLTTQLTNIRKKTLQITSITIPGANGVFSQANNCGSSLGAGLSCTINVTFTPPSAGLFDGRVLIEDEAPGSPQRVFLSGRGSSAARATRK